MIVNPITTEELDSLSEDEQLLLSFHSTIVFGMLFLDSDFRKNITPPFHWKVSKELDSDSTDPLAIIQYRGSAKSTLMKANIIKKLCWAKKAEELGIGERRSEFIGWSAANQEKSMANIAYVKMHLEHNEKIRYYFGNLVGNTWTQEKIITSNDDKVISSSNLKSLRGDTTASISEGTIRFSRIIADDAETEQNTITDLARIKFSNTIMDGMLPAIDTTIPGNNFVYINTPVHYAAFGQKILDSYFESLKDKKKKEEMVWRVVFQPAQEPAELDGKPVWPDRHTLEILKQEQKKYIASPRGIDGYYQEYLLQVQSSENAKFGRRVIKYHDYDFEIRDGFPFLVDENDNAKLVNTFIGCDPATDLNTSTSDYSVILIIAVDTKFNIYVLYYDRHRSIPTVAQRDINDKILGNMGVVDYILKRHQEYKCITSTVEDVAMTRSVWQSLNMRREKLNLWDLNIVPIRPGGQEKINKIHTGLNGYFQSGKIYIKKNMFELENEIVKFGPKMLHDDLIESLYFAIKNAYPPKNNLNIERDKENKIMYKKPLKKKKAWYLL